MTVPDISTYRFHDAAEVQAALDAIRPDDAERLELARDRWIRIMCDYCASGVWAKSGGAQEPVNLPLSAATIVRILDWQAWYDLFHPHHDDGTGWARHSAAMVARAGHSIACAVKRELPDWTVIYHDEARCDEVIARRLSHLPDTGPPFEYEITADMAAAEGHP